MFGSGIGGGVFSSEVGGGLLRSGSKGAATLVDRMGPIGIAGTGWVFRTVGMDFPVAQSILALLTFWTWSFPGELVLLSLLAPNPIPKELTDLLEV